VESPREEEKSSMQPKPEYDTPREEEKGESQVEKPKV
jgi:hypothetical protein